MDGRDGLQLLPGTKKRLGIKVPGENRFLYIGSAILGAVIVTSFWLNFTTKSLEEELKSVDEQIQSLEQKRNKQFESNIKLIQKQLAVTSELIDGHHYFSQAILKLASLIQEKVQVESLSIESDGTVTLGAFGANYITISRQLAAFSADDSIEDFTIGKIVSQSNGTLKFGMEIKFDKEKLLQKKK